MKLKKIENMVKTRKASIKWQERRRRRERVFGKSTGNGGAPKKRRFSASKKM
jgi:hypothetical protein